MTENNILRQGQEWQRFTLELPFNNEQNIALRGLLEAFGGRICEASDTATIQGQEAHTENPEEVIYLQKFNELLKTIETLDSRPVLDPKPRGLGGLALSDRNKKPFTKEEQDKFAAAGYCRVVMLGDMRDNRRVTVYQDTVLQADSGIHIDVDEYNTTHDGLFTGRQLGRTVTYSLGAAGGTQVEQGYSIGTRGVLADPNNEKITTLTGATIGNALAALQDVYRIQNGYWESTGVTY